MSKIVNNDLHDDNVKLMTTNGHAPVAGRQIRTSEHMVCRILDKTNNHGVPSLFGVYNRQRHRDTNMTPTEAIHKSNHLEVRVNLEIH